MRCLGLLAAVCLGLVGTAPAFAQSAPRPAPRASARASTAPAAEAPRRRATPRTHRDLMVPPGFGGPRPRSAPTSELIVPEIFRDDAPHRETRTPRAWQPRRVAGESELRVPAIFQVGREDVGFAPTRIDEGLRVPDIFRSRSVPAAERVNRVRDELRAPGFTSRPVADSPPAPAAAPPSVGLGRRLDPPRRR